MKIYSNFFSNIPFWHLKPCSIAQFAPGANLHPGPGANLHPLMSRSYSNKLWSYAPRFD